MDESYRSIGDSPDYRALCEELADKLAACWPSTFDPPDCLKRARAALVEPEPEVVEPTDEELLELTEDWPATTGPRHDLSGCPEVPLYSVFADEVVEFARAVLARWGHPAPVPVSERLPSASHVYFEFVISDADDCTQAGGIAPTYAQALSEGQHCLAQYQQDGPHTLELRRVEVLPPGALPVPQGKVQP